VNILDYDEEITFQGRIIFGLIIIISMTLFVTLALATQTYKLIEIKENTETSQCFNHNATLYNNVEPFMIQCMKYDKTIITLNRAGNIIRTDNTYTRALP
jgi:hypothetical protein